MTDKAPNEDLVPLASPIERLQRLLQRASNDPLTGQNTVEVLSRLFALEPIGTRENAARGHLMLLGLVREAREYAATRVAEFEGSPHSGAFSEIERIIADITVEQGWAVYAQQLRQLASFSLPFIQHATDAGRPAVFVQRTELDAIRASLERLLSRVLAATFPADFKSDFADAIRNLRDMIVNFEIHGESGVRRAAAVVVATIASNPKAARADKATVRETVETVSKLQDVFLKSASIGKIAARTIRLLLSGS